MDKAGRVAAGHVHRVVALALGAEPVIGNEDLVEEVEQLGEGLRRVEDRRREVDVDRDPAQLRAPPHPRAAD